MKKDLANTLGLQRPKPYMIEFKEIGCYQDRWAVDGKVFFGDRVEGAVELLTLLGDKWSPGDESIFFYELAVNLLAKMDNIKDEQLVKDIKDTRERMIKYEHVQAEKSV